MPRRLGRAAVTAAVFLSATVLLAAGPGGSRASGGVTAPTVARLQCENPRQLRLERYEDLSARLYCGWRLMARISVPY